MSTCTICGLTFDARASYGICKRCYSKDRLREHDRVESAVRQARNAGIVPITLCLPEWLATLSDFAGVCALCKRYSCSRILMVDRAKGLTYANVIPACYACEHHYIHGFNAAIEEIRRYLDNQTLPRLVLPDPSEEEVNAPHVEYH